jgi:murein DD-endopeptidase MepM/ murein hydrolase activator NlpD
MARTKYVAALAALPIAVPILLLAMVGGTASRPPPYCGTGVTAAQPATDGELDAEQRTVAAQIVAAVRAFPPTADKPHAAVIALATARQESSIRNLDYGDRDSLGVFQQRPSQGWGTPAQVMDVAHATTSFLEHLVRIPGWESRPVTDVAADVQRPAEEYRGLYEQWVPLATRLTDQLWSRATVSLVTSSMAATGCDTAVLVSAGQVVYPVPTPFIGTDAHNWGDTGSHWSNWHTGTDFSVPCGTPVLAATSGNIEIDPSQAWAGPLLVKVVTGPSSVATWYAHMQELEVNEGQTVRAGQQLGEVGALGNASGCHLHFEVHLHNGTIYGPDNVNPSQWLAQHASPAGAPMEG